MRVHDVRISIKQCFDCGKKGGILSGLKGSNCTICGRSFCSEHFFVLHTGPLSVLEKVWNQQIGFFEKKLPSKVNEWVSNPTTSSLNIPVPICSDKCAKEFILKTIPLEKEYVGRVQRKFLTFDIEWYQGETPYTDTRIILRENFTDKENLRQYYDKQLAGAFGTEDLRENAEIAIQSGRFEDAAKMFEQIGDYKKAGRARAMEKTSKQVVQQQIVNLNTLLDQLKTQNMVVPYKCPNCHGTIKISGSTEQKSLHKCQYCGTVLAKNDLAEYLRSVLM